MRAFVAFFICSVFVFASEHETSYDILPRTVNFVVFAILIYYLIANALADFFAKRKEEIASKFEKAQERITSAKSKQEQAKLDLEKAKDKATQIVQNSKKEAELLRKNLISKHEQVCEILRKQKEESQEVARKKMIREIVSQEMEVILGSVSANKESMLNTLIKRMAS